MGKKGSKSVNLGLRSCLQRIPSLAKATHRMRALLMTDDAARLRKVFSQEPYCREAQGQGLLWYSNITLELIDIRLTFCVLI